MRLEYMYSIPARTLHSAIVLCVKSRKEVAISPALRYHLSLASGGAPGFLRRAARARNAHGTRLARRSLRLSATAARRPLGLRATTRALPATGTTVTRDVVRLPGHKYTAHRAAAPSCLYNGPFGCLGTRHTDKLSTHGSCMAPLRTQH